MKWWQIRAALRGNSRQHRQMWEAQRMHAWVIASMFSSDKSRMQTPRDLFRYSWEETETDMPTDEEIENLRELLERENEGK